MANTTACNCGTQTLLWTISKHDGRWWCPDCMWAEIERLRKTKMVPSVEVSRNPIECGLMWEVGEKRLLVIKLAGENRLRAFYGEEEFVAEAAKAAKED